MGNKKRFRDLPSLGHGTHGGALRQKCRVLFNVDLTSLLVTNGKYWRSAGISLSIEPKSPYFYTLLCAGLHVSSSFLGRKNPLIHLVFLTQI